MAGKCLDQRRAIGIRQTRTNHGGLVGIQPLAAGQPLDCGNDLARVGMNRRQERPAAEQAALPLHPSGEASRRTTRAIEDIQSAERMLERRQRSQESPALIREGRQQRGVGVYQSLQQDEERSYVSEVLGIDVYA